MSLFNSKRTISELDNLTNHINSQKPVIVGSDLGYGQVKVLSDNQKYKFLSTVGTPISDFGRVATITSTAELLDTLTVTYNGQKYYIGHNAIVNTRNGRINLRQNKAENEDNKIKFMTSLALLMDQEQEEMDAIIVTGLPVLEYNNQKDKLYDMIYNFGQPFIFDMHYGSKVVSKKINIKDIKIISQGEGAFYDYILDTNGQIVPERASNVQGTVMVVDPGYKTTDIVTMENGRYIETLSDQFNKGVSQIHQEVLRLIMSNHGIKKELKDMDEIVRTGRLFHNTKEYNVQNLIDQAAEPFATDIVDNLINLSNDSLGSMQRIILSGGGSSIIYPYIKKQLEDIIEVDIMEDSEFCNTSGYYKYGKLLESAGAFNA